MLKNRNLTSLVAVLLSALMLLSLLTVSAFADTDTAEDVTEESVVVTNETEETTEPAGDEETTAESETETTTGDETTAADTTATTTAATTTAAATEADTTAEAQKKQENLTRAIVNLVVGVLILALAIVLIVKFRSKIPAWWKALKSECGKIVWCPKDKLKKNTLVVIIIIVLLAVVIGVLDYAFSKGIILLGDIVR